MQGCRSDLHKHNSLCLDQLMSMEQTVVRLSHVVLRVQQYLQELGAVPVLQMFLKSISKQTELRHSTNYFLLVAASIILSTSPRFSEVLLNRGRHSKWPISILTFWDIGFSSFQKNLKTTVHCAPQLNFPFIALNAFAAITLAQ